MQVFLLQVCFAASVFCCKCFFAVGFFFASSVFLLQGFFLLQVFFYCKCFFLLQVFSFAASVCNRDCIGWSNSSCIAWLLMQCRVSCLLWCNVGCVAYSFLTSNAMHKFGYLDITGVQMCRVSVSDAFVEREKNY